MTLIKKIILSGFKSIKHLELELGRINVFIGGNGAGKSNLLSFFRMLRKVNGGEFQDYLLKKEGGANRVLFMGVKQTGEMRVSLDVEDRLGTLYRYASQWAYAAEDSLIFEKESTLQFDKAQNTAMETSIEVTHRESMLKNSGELKQTDIIIWNLFDGIRNYHFHDTSWTAGMRQHSGVHDHVVLRDDGENLASILYKLKQSRNTDIYYDRILGTIRQILPWFGDFVFDLRNSHNEMVMLNWRGPDPDYVFSAHQLPDGGLRAIALITLLLQPEDRLPKVIVIDEPELGLHPAAVCTIASLLHHASYHAQIIIATQSPTLLDYFEPDNVIAVDRDRASNSSEFKRLTQTALQDWLEDYSLSELWEKNVFGGGPF